MTEQEQKHIGETIEALISKVSNKYRDDARQELWIAALEHKNLVNALKSYIGREKRHGLRERC